MEARKWCSVRKPGTKALRATIKYRSTYLYDDLGYLRFMSMIPEKDRKRAKKDSAFVSIKQKANELGRYTSPSPYEI